MSRSMCFALMLSRSFCLFISFGRASAALVAHGNVPHAGKCAQGNDISRLPNNAKRPKCVRRLQRVIGPLPSILYVRAFAVRGDWGEKRSALAKITGGLSALFDAFRQTNLRGYRRPSGRTSRRLSQLRILAPLWGEKKTHFLAQASLKLTPAHESPEFKISWGLKVVLLSASISRQRSRWGEQVNVCSVQSCLIGKVIRCLIKAWVHFFRSACASFASN